MRTKHGLSFLFGAALFILLTCSLSSLVSSADEKWYLGTFSGQWKSTFRNFTLTITEENNDLAVVYEYGSKSGTRLDEENRLADKANWKAKVISDKKIIIGVAPSPVITVTIEGNEITAKWEWKNQMPNYATLKKR